MREQARRSGLELEAAEPLGIGGQTRGEGLDGDLAAEPGITSAMHLAHAPRANQAEDLIGPEHRAGRPWHRDYISSNGEVEWVESVE
jgi:hypothetical protein